jgi:DUF1680 family protein
MIASLGNYIHSVSESGLYTHLFIGSEAKIKLGGADVSVKIETKYPWEGKVDISFSVKSKTIFKYGFRIPGWCKKFSVNLNGAAAAHTIDDGFALIEREWSSGDKISIEFDMPVSFVKTNPKVRDNIGKTAVMRGPVVYCLEEEDNGKELFKIHASNPRDIKVSHEKDFLEGLTTISFTGKREKDWEGNDLYGTEDPVLEDKKLLFIPYYAWANRKEGEMTVWIKR